MSLILSFDTSTKNCSVALFEKEKLLSIKQENAINYSHSEQLTVFIEDVLKTAKISKEELNAVAIGRGPGSYTGLRIGTSTAKGLCYALDIPLISIPTLQAMAFGLSKQYNSDLFCPMIDARRMEVFAALYDQNNNTIREVRADILENETYQEYLNKKIVFFGDGAAKYKNVLKHTNAIFIDEFLVSAEYIGYLAYNRFVSNKFEDVAYFEPFYLKDFVTNSKAV
tara:strand:+ start:1519 stop:2193 length:675 start_codon:yes stop_codon:yes gene_type:complete